MTLTEKDALGIIIMCVGEGGWIILRCHSYLQTLCLNNSKESLALSKKNPSPAKGSGRCSDDDDLQHFRALNQEMKDRRKEERQVKVK